MSKPKNLTPDLKAIDLIKEKNIDFKNRVKTELIKKIYWVNRVQKYWNSLFKNILKFIKSKNFINQSVN